MNVPILWKVVPVVPTNLEAKAHLQNDLDRRDCGGLLQKPWGFCEEEMVAELLLESQSNQFSRTLRAKLGQWGEREGKEVYSFEDGGSGLANRKDTYLLRFFLDRPDSKEGYSVIDCQNLRARILF